jgi:cell division protein FtsX
LTKSAKVIFTLPIVNEVFSLQLQFGVLAVLGAAFMVITIKYVLLSREMSYKKRTKRIITPDERIFFRNWTILFIGSLVAILAGCTAVLLISL